MAGVNVRNITVMIFFSTEIKAEHQTLAKIRNLFNPFRAIKKKKVENCMVCFKNMQKSVHFVITMPFSFKFIILDSKRF